MMERMFIAQRDRNILIRWKDKKRKLVYQSVFFRRGCFFSSSSFFLLLRHASKSIASRISAKRSPAASRTVYKLVVIGGVEVGVKIGVSVTVGSGRLVDDGSDVWLGVEEGCDVEVGEGEAFGF